MSFEKFLFDDVGTENFSKGVYVRSSKERQNLSKGILDSDLGCRYLTPNELFSAKYSEFDGISYISALTLTYEKVLTIYDANSRRMFVHRYLELTAAIGVSIEKGLKLLKNPRLEGRLIGAQSNQVYYLNSTMQFLRKNKIPLVEIDLFGNEIRNLAFELKSGVSFDVLTNNRLYKPGELLNKTTVEQFERESTTRQEVVAKKP